MRNAFSTTSLIAATLLSAAALLTPMTASAAKDGTPSAGKGLKCFFAPVKQADGSVTLTRVCYKGV